MKALLPFTPSQNSELLKIETEIYHLASDELLIEFRFLGPTERVRFPEPSATTSRRNGLWKHTCLEVFGTHDLLASTPYWEANCSTSGDWNAYSFSSYRADMAVSDNMTVELVQREASFQEAFFRVRIKGAALQQTKHLGVTAVIEFMDDSRSYFALKHAGPQPDFHLKESFTISL